MKGLGRQASFLALLALLATAFSTAAYGLWHEELTVSATINTGTLDGALSCTNQLDNEGASWPATAPYSSYPSASPLKNKASATLQAIDTHRVQVVVLDAYPGYAFRCDLRVANSGTVAWHVEDIAFDILKCDQQGANCTPVVPGPQTWTTRCNGIECAWGDLGVSPANPALLPLWSPLYATVRDYEGCQVHSTDPALAASLFGGINQSAAKLSVYKVSLSYRLYQWNESAWTGCNEPRT